MAASDNWGSGHEVVDKASLLGSHVDQHADRKAQSGKRDEDGSIPRVAAGKTCPGRYTDAEPEPRWREVPYGGHGLHLVLCFTLTFGPDHWRRSIPQR